MNECDGGFGMRRGKGGGRSPGRAGSLGRAQQMRMEERNVKAGGLSWARLRAGQHRSAGQDLGASPAGPLCGSRCTGGLSVDPQAESIRHAIHDIRLESAGRASHALEVSFLCR